MPYKAIREAEKTFRIAICNRAAQFDKETIQRAETVFTSGPVFCIERPDKEQDDGGECTTNCHGSYGKNETEKHGSRAI